MSDLGHGGMTKRQWWDASRFFCEGGVADDFRRCTDIDDAILKFKSRCGFAPRLKDMKDMLNFAGITLADAPKSVANVADGKAQQQRYEELNANLRELTKALLEWTR